MKSPYEGMTAHMILANIIASQSYTDEDYDALRCATIAEASVGVLTKESARKGSIQWNVNDNPRYHAGIYDIVPRKANDL